MNTLCKRGFLVAVILALFSAPVFAPNTQAATLYWNSGEGDEFPIGGTGTWGDSTTNWSDDSMNKVPWSNGNTAFFDVPAGTVTISRTLGTDVAGLKFGFGVYTLAGTSASPITMNSGAKIDATTGTTTISAILAGSNGIEKVGTGLVVLSGANTFTGDVVISDGTLAASGSGGIGNVGVPGPFGSGSTIILNNSLGTTTPTLGSYGSNDQLSNKALRVYGTCYINPSAGPAVGDVYIQGNDTVITSGRLVFSNNTNRHFFMEGKSGFNGGVFVGSNARFFQAYQFAGVGQPSSLGAVTGINSGTYSDLTFGGTLTYHSGRFLPWTHEQSSTTAASWRIPDGLYGEIVHFGMTYLNAGGNRFEMSGNAAATSGRLYVEGGNPNYTNKTTGQVEDPANPGSYLGYRYDTFDNPTRLVLSGQNAFSGGIELGMRNVNSYHFISVSTIGNAGETGNLGASPNAVNGANLMFCSGWLEYTGVTASTNRTWQIASDNTYSNAKNLTRARTDAKFIITNASTTLTMTGDSYVIADTFGPWYRGLRKTGPGTLRLEGNQAYRGRTLLFHHTYDGNPNGETDGLYAGTLSLGANAQTAIWSGSGADIQSGMLTMDTSAVTSAASVLAQLDGPGIGYNATPKWSAGIFQNTAAASTGLTLGWKDDGTSISIMATVMGDADLDGLVTPIDYEIVVTHLGQLGNWDDGDFNYDGVVNSEDFSHVPEPSSVVMLLILLVSATVWRIARRRCG
jgi:fibronectin-binding autotransporter adhesin